MGWLRAVCVSVWIQSPFLSFLLFVCLCGAIGCGASGVAGWLVGERVRLCVAYEWLGAVV